MARLYRIQLDKCIIDCLAQGLPIATEILKFDSEYEKEEFIRDPEAFVRKIGLYTPEMKFNGIRLPKGITLDQLQKDPSKASISVGVIHEPSCQLAWDLV